MHDARLPNAKFYTPIFFVILLISFCGDAHATSVAVLESKQGFVILADSKQMHEGTDKTFCRGDEIKKIFIANKKFAISAVGIGCADLVYRKNGVIVGTRFNIDSAWIDELQSALPKDVSMPEFIKGLVSKFAALTPQLQIALTDGYINPSDSINFGFEPFIKFVVVGYDGGIPTICMVDFNIDWHKRQFILPPHGWSGDLRPINNFQMGFYVFGWAQGITDIPNPQSYAYKNAMSICPKAFINFLSGRPVSLDESIAIGKALVQIEEKIDPNHVGGHITGVKILPTGVATELSDFAPLPKARTGKRKEAKK
jgi:hypothetical protein